MIVDVAEWRPDILEEHAELLGSLWNRRLLSERSAIVDRLALTRMDRRIVANADALVLAGGHAVRFLAGLLDAGEPHTAAAAALVIAQTDEPATIARLVEALTAAAPEVRVGFWAALDLVAGPRLREALLKLTSESELVAGTLAVLAAHGDPRAAAMQPERFLLDPAPAARTLAWRAVRRLAEGIRLDPAYYQHGMIDGDPVARRAALEAAAMTRQRAFVDYLRQLASTPHLSRLEEHLFFAALAGPADVDAVRALGANAAALGWERYRILALCGRAAVVEDLLAVMRAGDEVEGALAGAAFYRITGADASAGERVPLVPPGQEPDDFTDEIRACDPAKAEKAWKGLKGAMGAARWAYGVDVEATPPESLPPEVDLEILWAAELRAAFKDPKRRLRFAHERLSSSP